MKCIAAVVMVALAVVAEGSYVPSTYAHHGYPVAPVVTYAAKHVYNPTVVQSNDQLSWAHAAAVHNTWAHQAPVVAYNNYVQHVPAVAYNKYAQHVPAVVAYNNQWDHHNTWDNLHHQAAVVAVAPVQHSASYVAANRGAVHKAPLVGHTVNQKSLNLAPAPGTW